MSADGITLATPFSVSLRSTKATKWSDGMALSSTRSPSSRKPISSCVAPLMRSEGERPPVLADVDGFRLKPKLLHVGQPRPRSMKLSCARIEIVAARSASS